jgi:hypothetical protein
MSKAEFFSGQAIQASNPLRPYGYTRIAVGGIFSAISLAILARTIPLLRDVITSQGRILNNSAQIQGELLPS